MRHAPCCPAGLSAEVEGGEATAASKLLDLPLDLLKAILKEVTNTNDLSALALSCSTIHQLVVPLIYSRFDIVWPDGSTRADARTGVDALTFGLATLVMRGDLFQQPGIQDVGHVIGSNSHSHDPSGIAPTPRSIRRGNNYSQHIKTFSLGNGPPDLVRDYLITKDAGKLLGTLVALALLRMPNLENFTWDMPTGIVRDVWISLAENSHLTRLSVRFHDNQKAYDEEGLIRSASSRGLPPMDSAGLRQLKSPLLNDDPAAGRLVGHLVFTKTHVESPNFAVLPPLAAISAVEINELANLDELSVLIAKSANQLKELRIGLVDRLLSSGLPQNSRALQYLDPRYGTAGVLTLLFSGLPRCEPLGRYSDHHTEGLVTFEPLIGGGQAGEIVELGEARAVPASSLLDLDVGASFASNRILDPLGDDSKVPDPPSVDAQNDNGNANHFEESEEQRVATACDCQAARQDCLPVLQHSDEEPIDPMLRAAYRACSKATKSSADEDQASNFETEKKCTLRETTNARRQRPWDITSIHPAGQRLNTKLLLTHLELERLVLHVTLLHRAIEFATLEHLTLLKCTGTNELWKFFNGHFQPNKQTSPTSTVSPRPFELDVNGSQSRLRRTPTSIRTCATVVYRMRLKRIHTDTVSHHMLTFLKETLAPNSLESLFLQDDPSYKSPVTVNQIWKGPVCRQRGSLTRLLIDSSAGLEISRPTVMAAKKWAFHREALSSLVVRPKKAPRLRELSISLQYKDFHWFLQQLPHVESLRSLHIPWIIDHVNGNHFNIRDAALNVVNVINLRRECQLAYLAIQTKCYELVETRAIQTCRKQGVAIGHPDDDDESSIDEPLDEQDDVSDEESNSNADSDEMSGVESDDNDEEGEDYSDDEGQSSSSSPAPTRIRMREILFYDDRISIFKARHGKL